MLSFWKGGDRGEIFSFLSASRHVLTSEQGVANGIGRNKPKWVQEFSEQGQTAPKVKRHQKLAKRTKFTERKIAWSVDCCDVVFASLRPLEFLYFTYLSMCDDVTDDGASMAPKLPPNLRSSNHRWSLSP